MFGSPTPTKQTRWPASSRAAATIIISDLREGGGRGRDDAGAGRPEARRRAAGRAAARGSLIV